MSFTPFVGSTGFEMGSADVIKAAYRLGTVTVRTADPAPRTGNYYLMVSAPTSAGGAVRLDAEGTPSEVYLSLGVHGSTIWTQSGIIYIVMVGGNHVSLRWNNSTKAWDAYRGESKIASGAVSVTETAWHHVQVRLLVDGTNGVLQTRIDGAPDIAFAGNTQPGASNVVAYAQFFVGWFNTGYIDDWAFGVGGWPGDYRCEALAVNSDVSSSLVPSTGSTIYGMLDDIPPAGDYALLRADFRAEIDSGETISTAFQSGALYTANGNEVPDVGMRFLVIGTADFSGGQLATAKGSAVAAGDLFEVTNNTEGTEAVSYVVPRTLHGIASWNKQYKVLKHVALYARARKLEAVDSRMALAIKLADQALSIGDQQTMLTTYTYITRMLATPPGYPEWRPDMLNGLQIGAEIKLD